MKRIAVEAAKKLARENLDAEVIDPRTIKPLDKEAILDSVRKREGYSLLRRIPELVVGALRL